jgi:hypothetical protein
MVSAVGHPYADPGDGRTRCPGCTKWIFPIIHSCKGVPPVNQPSTAHRDIVLCDIDSTIADTRHRRALCPTVDPESTWDRYAAACEDDAPITGVIAVLRLAHAAGCDIHLVSNRPVAARAATSRWLVRYNVPCDVLWLRLPSHPTGVSHKLDYLARLRAIGRTVVLAIEDWPAEAAALEAQGVPVLCPNPRYDSIPVPA